MTHRQPSGTPIGGQFAPIARPGADASVTLGERAAPAARAARTRELVDATCWEADGGIDRYAFNDALPDLPAGVRDAAWASVEHITSALEATRDGSFIEEHDEDHDRVTMLAWDQATGREDLVGEFHRLASEAYDDELRVLCEALSAAQDGESITYRPVAAHLPEVSYDPRGAAHAPMAA